MVKPIFRYGRHPARRPQAALPDFGEVFAALRTRGVRCGASGRSFVSLRAILLHMPGMPDCICDNGAYLVEDGRVGEIRVIARDKLHRFCAPAGHTRAEPDPLRAEGTYFLRTGGFCGPHGSYFRNARQWTTFCGAGPDFQGGVSDNASSRRRSTSWRRRCGVDPISGVRGWT
ncbi:MAG: hypothetical protein ACLSAP_02635 [Oscillospiraceae bacterium]